MLDKVLTHSCTPICLAIKLFYRTNRLNLITIPHLFGWKNFKTPEQKKFTIKNLHPIFFCCVAVVAAVAAALKKRNPNATIFIISILFYSTMFRINCVVNKVKLSKQYLVKLIKLITICGFVRVRRITY